MLLLDEPLAAMGAKEAALILDLIRDIKRKGDVSVIVIAHNYGQVLEIADRVNLLQQGEITFDKPSAETSVQELNDIVIAEYRRALRSASAAPDRQALHRHELDAGELAEDPPRRGVVAEVHHLVVRAARGQPSVQALAQPGVGPELAVGHLQRRSSGGLSRFSPRPPPGGTGRLPG